MTKQEITFCEYLAASLDMTAAAKISGFTESPEKEAARLLEKPSVRRRCKKMLKNRSDVLGVTAGLSKIAFSNPIAAVSAIFDKDIPDFSGCDLFCVSEIKKGTNGAIEIKFFDKLKALQILSELFPGDNESKMKGFYKAILEGAKSVSENRSEEE